MFITDKITHVGRYLLMMSKLFHSLERPFIYYKLIMRNIVSMVLSSLSIVLIIATFVGAVTTLQTAYQLISPMIPRSTIGSIVSASTMLELAPTVVTFILAGMMGSSIASEIGTMRVTEQIDALEVMGINSVAYLVLPKMLASLVVYPILVTISAFLCHLGGIVAGEISGSVSTVEFTQGVQQWFEPVQVRVMYTKAFVFGFLISTISAYQGYYTRGGALEVGQACTKAVVQSCIAMVVADYFVAQILLD